MKNKIVFLIISFQFISFFTFGQVNFQWAKSFGGALDDYGNSIAADGAGNVYTTGSFSGTADFDPGSSVFNLTATGLNDIFVSKLDASGNFVWAWKFGSTSGDVGSSITVDAFNNIYVTGWFNETVDFDPSPSTLNLTSSGGNDVFVIKINSSGNLVWAKKMGGANNDVGNSIVVDAGGNVFTTGYFTGIGDFDPGAVVFNLTSYGSADIFVSKLDASGNFVWAKGLGGTSFEFGLGVYIDNSGNVYSTGYFFGTIDCDPGPSTYTIACPGSNANIFVSKLDASGNFVWAKSMGGSATNGDEASSVVVDISGNVYTTGVFNGTADFDPGSGTYTLVSAGGYDNIYISKLDPSGNFAWAKSFGSGIGNTVGRSITLDLIGNVYTTGYFGGTIDFDPGVGVFNLTSSGDDVFLSKLDPTGAFISAENMGGGSIDVGQSIFIDASGSIYLTGYFESVGGDFDPGSGTSYLSTVGANDIFVVKFNTTVGIEEKSNPKNAVKVYPNPANGKFYLQIENLIENPEMRITNIFGQEMKSEKINSKKTEIDLSEFSNGIYFIHLYQNKNLISTQKLIKQ